jgi:hypothetical protein
MYAMGSAAGDYNAIDSATVRKSARCLHQQESSWMVAMRLTVRQCDEWEVPSSAGGFMVGCMRCVVQVDVHEDPYPLLFTDVICAPPIRPFCVPVGSEEMRGHA